MSFSPSKLLQEFMDAFGKWRNREFKIGNEHDSLSYNLIYEEFEEWEEVSSTNLPEEELEELADLVIVCFFRAETFGWNLEEAIKRKMQANMSKLGEDGAPILREDGKILKGPNYTPAYFGDLV